MWKEGDHVIFECTVEETGKSCLTGGWAKLGSKTGLNSDNNNVIVAALKSDAVFDEMAAKLQPDMAANVGAIFRWIIINQTKQPCGQWGM